MSEKDDAGGDLTDAEVKKRMETKCEEWGISLEKKADDFTKIMPPPVNAFLDALCLSVVIVFAAWAFKMMNFIGSMPSYKMLGIVFGAIFAVSLVARLLIKSKKSK